ncbi:MAG TPA: DUF3300 domain-containing protein [Candidatus Binatia bacterium]|nr:DUF3300 domain-containing protein [Candidatus Binatia bacterium]
MASAKAQEYGPPDYPQPGDAYPDYRGGAPAPYPDYRGPGGPNGDYRGPGGYADYRMSPDQLENLLAPVALYPDPLLAQILVAATFADQIDNAARWMRSYNDPYGVDAQPWDVSVKAIAHYPKVLFMMADRIDWTTALGQAYVEQPADVSAAVQHLRFMARNAGNLATNDYWEVIPSGGFIAIEPIQPQFIFVPDYAPDVVFFRPATFVFGPAFPIGPWLNCDWDWRGHRVYYHGWHGPGWVERSRPFVRTSNVYVNDRFRNIRVNRDIVRRNVRVENLNRFNTVHRDANFNNFARRNDRITADRNFRRDDSRRLDNGRGFDNNRRDDRRFDNNRAFDNRRGDRSFDARRDGQIQRDDRAARLRDRPPQAFQNNAPRDDRFLQGRDERAAQLQEQRRRDFDNRSRGLQDNRGRGIENRPQFRDARPQGAENSSPLRENNRRQFVDNRRQSFQDRSSQRLENQNRSFDRQRGPENRALPGRDAAREHPVNNRPQQEFTQSQRNERRAAAQPAPERGATAATRAAESRRGDDARSAQRNARAERRDAASQAF